MTDQTQKAGDNSTNVQAGSITINQGTSIDEVRQIAIDVFRSNFSVLAGEAKNIAQQRAEEVTENFLKRLQTQNPLGLTQAQEPDFQHSLFVVQKEFARCGDKELGDLLVDLLVDRTKQPSRSILQIVLNESLTVAPKLTIDQLAALSLIFTLRYTLNNSVTNRIALGDYLDLYIKPFGVLITDKAACYQHLEYAGCGTVSLGSFELADVFKKNYGALFSRGVSIEQIQQSNISLPASARPFINCLNDSSRFQVGGLNEDSIRSMYIKQGITEQDLVKLINLHNNSLPTNDEIAKSVITLRPYMENVFKIWTGSNIKQFNLTSIGIAIGHANTKKLVGEFADLSIWIN